VENGSYTSKGLPNIVEASEKAKSHERWKFFNAIIHETIDDEVRKDFKRKLAGSK